MNYYKLHSDQSVINQMEKIASEYNEEVNGCKLKDNLNRIQCIHSDLEQLCRSLRIIIILSILLSALTMIVGIVALLFGHKLCLNQKWIAMIIESALAAVALGWTVAVVIPMLAEPEEPKEQSS